MKPKVHELLKETKMNVSKTLIKQLFFDREMVEAIKVAKANKEILYAQLINGRITMKEYIAMTKK